MAHSNSAKKRIRQNLKHRARNRWRKDSMKGAVKKFLDRLAHGSAAEAQEAFKTAVSVIDRSASRGVIHKNQASRRKSRMNVRLKAKVKGKAAA